MTSQRDLTVNEVAVLYFIPRSQENQSGNVSEELEPFVTSQGVASLCFLSFRGVKRNQETFFTVSPKR